MPKRIASGLSVTPQPGKADIARFAELGYRTLINNRPDGEAAGRLSAAEASAEAQRLQMRYVHLPVSASAITRSDVEAFHRALRENPAPAVAHCKSGTRSYLLWAAGEALAGRRNVEDLLKQAAADGYDVSALPALLARLERDERSGRNAQP